MPPAEILTFASLTAANTFQARIHAWCQANIIGYNAVRWSVVETHPVTANLHNVKLKNRIDAALTAPERAAKITRAANWNPV